MTKIILTSEQVQVLQDAAGEITLLDDAGNLVGVAQLLFTPQELAEAKRCAESSEERRTTEQVLARMQELETRPH